MTAPATATVTGTFPASVSANPVFVPSCTVSFDTAPELLPSSPLTAKVAAGALTALDGSPLALPLTSAGSPVGPTGFWFWTAKNLPGVPDFSFFLTADADITDLIQSGLPAGGGGAFGGGTLTKYLAPAVVTLTDATTIAVDASLGNDFRVTLAGNRTMGAPSNPADGQAVTFEVVQDATGSRTLTWDAAYHFGSGSAPTLSTAASATDLVAFRYSASKSGWLYLGSALGF